jgi:hypothetical protein
MMFWMEWSALWKTVSSLLFGRAAAVDRWLKSRFASGPQSCLGKEDGKSTASRWRFRSVVQQGSAEDCHAQLEQDTHQPFHDKTQAHAPAEAPEPATTRQ